MTDEKCARCGKGFANRGKAKVIKNGKDTHICMICKKDLFDNTRNED